MIQAAKGAGPAGRADRARHQGRLGGRPRRSSTWWTSSASSRASGTRACGCCAPPRTATAPPTRSAASTCPSRGIVGLPEPQRAVDLPGGRCRPGHLPDGHAGGSLAAGRGGAVARRTERGTEPRAELPVVSTAAASRWCWPCSSAGSGARPADQDVYVSTIGGARVVEAGRGPGAGAGGGELAGERAAPAAVADRLGRAGRGDSDRLGLVAGWPRRHGPGFTRAIAPAGAFDGATPLAGLTVPTAADLGEAVTAAGLVPDLASAGSR